MQITNNCLTLLLTKVHYFLKVMLFSHTQCRRFLVSTSSLKPLHVFASNFVWMFLGWTPTKFVKIGVLPLFVMESWVILCNFWPILKKNLL